MKKIVICGIVLTSCMIVSACAEDPPTADQQQRHQQEELSERSNMAAGMPNIHNFFEKKNYRRILELRDDPNLVTYTYTRDYNGKLHKVCDSIGFPIPGATQYTNPQRLTWSYNYSHGDVLALPQADPNGLFSPAEEDATWVLCQNPKNPKDIEPTYQENKVETFMWQMPSVD